MIRTADVYWDRLKNLGNDVKRMLIERLSSSISEADVESGNACKEGIEHFCGAWAEDDNNGNERM